MAEVTVYNQAKEKQSTRQLHESWDSPIHRQAIFEVALWHQNRRRRGTAAVKGRSDVRGSGRKIYRQKGTGNARHSDRQANIFVGGGIAMGPQTRDWSYAIPKKERRTALRSLLIHKLKEGALWVIDGINFAEAKTKEARVFFKAWPFEGALVVLDKVDDKIIKAMRNLPNVSVASADSLCVADLLAHENVIMTDEAFSKVEKRWVQKI